jgi:hypothetical protein
LSGRKPPAGSASKVPAATAFTTPPAAVSLAAGKAAALKGSGSAKRPGSNPAGLTTKKRPSPATAAAGCEGEEGSGDLGNLKSGERGGGSSAKRQKVAKHVQLCFSLPAAVSQGTGDASAEGSQQKHTPGADAAGRSGSMGSSQRSGGGTQSQGAAAAAAAAATAAAATAAAGVTPGPKGGVVLVGSGLSEVDKAALKKLAAATGECGGSNKS